MRFDRHIRTIFVLLTIWISWLPGSAQDLQGRFYPEKDSYMLGEPVFFNMEIKNTGKEAVYVNAKDPNKCLNRFEFFVGGQGAGCGATDNLDCNEEPTAILAGDSYSERWPLSDRYQFKRDGKYEDSVTRHITIQSAHGGLQDFTLSSKFTVNLTPTDPVRVQSILQDFERDVYSRDPEVRHKALDALIMSAPSYLEGIALTLSRDKDPFVVLHAAVALGRMNTPEARAALADVITSREESTHDEIMARIRAIEALGRSGDASYLGLVQRYADDKNEFIQLNAMFAIAELGKTEAVPELQRYFLSTDATVRKNAAYALSYSTTPEAVEALINAITDKDVKVRERVLTSLNELTHQTVGDNPTDGASPEKIQSAWRSWWKAHKDKIAFSELQFLCNLK